MGDPYTAPTISGYNASPPADDGTESEANRTTWSGIKNKFGDPLKTFVDGVNTALSTAFGKVMGGGSVTSTAIDYTVLGSDQGGLVVDTAGGNTITTPVAATVGAPFAFAFTNNGSSDTTIDGAGSETIDGAASIVIAPDRGVIIFTDGTNWFTTGKPIPNLTGTLGVFTSGATGGDQGADSINASEYYKDGVAFTSSDEFVSTSAFTAATTKVITGMVAGYDYIVQMDGIAPTTDGSVLWLRLSDDDGSTYEADSGDYEWSVTSQGVGSRGTNDTKIAISGTSNTLGNDSTQTAYFEIKLINPAGTALNTVLTWDGGYHQVDATPLSIKNDGWGQFAQGTGATTALQLLWDNGSTFKAQGNLTVWRRKRAA